MPKPYIGTETEKLCSRCLALKPKLEFHRRAEGREGRSTTCKACRCADRRKSYRANPLSNEQKEKIAAYQKAYREQNLEALTASKRERYKERKVALWPNVLASVRRRWANDPAFRLKLRVSCLLRNGLKGKKGGRTSQELLGYTLHELSDHLERQFLKGMSWENMGDWQIDHIVPISSFTITGPDDPELRRAWALTNLRPLWARDNQRKGAEIQTLL